MTERPAESGEAPGLRLSIIIPVYNEARSFPALLERLRGCRQDWPASTEVLVVDDGSTDGGCPDPGEPWLRVVRHPVNLGNGASVKTGIRQARGEWCVVLDGDGQHDPAEIPKLLAGLERYSLVVGKRDLVRGGARHRNWANRVYSRLASYAADYRIEDLTCGFRAFRRREVLDIVHLFPNRFSCPSTMTMGLIKMGYPVAFVPIAVRPREGRSKLRPLSDGLRFLMIIMKITTLFSPMKMFLPLSLSLAAVGAANYAWVLLTAHRFSVWSAVFFTCAITVFMIGLVAEEVSYLNFRRERS